MHGIYLNPYQWEGKAGRIKKCITNHKGFTKRSQQSPVGSMPTSMKDQMGKERFFLCWEVDRMPINSVRSPLLNPHESKNRSFLFTTERHAKHAHTEEEKIVNDNKRSRRLE